MTGRLIKAGDIEQESERLKLVLDAVTWMEERDVLCFPDIWEEMRRRMDRRLFGEPRY